MTQNTSENQIEGLDEAASEGWGEYPLDTVFVRTEARSVKEVIGRIEKGRYQLDPDFQRDFVWPPDKQSRLIESALMRIPLPVFYVAEDQDGKIIVVDGLQRLTTFYRYLTDSFALKGLESADSDKMISGKRFSELPIHLQERIEDTQLTLYILDAKAPERARLDIFERVNSGVPLTRQQMRNCLYSGRATAKLKSFSLNKSFLRTTGSSLDSKSMRDREVINRFCAFFLLGPQDYKGDMDSFLAKALSDMNKIDDEKLNQLEAFFVTSMDLNYKVFGEHSFRKSLANGNQYSGRTVLNVSLFDVFSVLFALYWDKISKTDCSKIREPIQNLFANSEFIQSITYSTNSTTQVKKRFAYAENALREALK